MRAAERATGLAISFRPIGNSEWEALDLINLSVMGEQPDFAPCSRLEAHIGIPEGIAGRDTRDTLPPAPESQFGFLVASNIGGRSFVVGSR